MFKKNNSNSCVSSPRKQSDSFSHISNVFKNDKINQQSTIITDLHHKNDTAQSSRTASPVPLSKSISSISTRSRLVIPDSSSQSLTPDYESNDSPIILKSKYRQIQSIHQHLPIYVQDIHKAVSLSTFPSPVGITPLPKRLRSAKLLNQLSKSTIKMTMDVIAKHYLANPLVSEDELQEIISLQENHISSLSIKLQSLSFLAHYTNQMISRISRTERLQSSIKELLQQQRIDLRCDRTFPLQRDLNLFQSALKHTDKLIQERKKLQDKEEALWIEKIKNLKPTFQYKEIKKESDSIILQKKTTFSSIMSDIRNYFRPIVSLKLPEKKRFISDSSYEEDEDCIPRKRLAKRNRVTSDEEGIIDIEGCESDSEGLNKTLFSPNMYMTMVDRLRPRTVIHNLPDDGKEGSVSIATATTIRSIDLTLRLDEETKKTNNQQLKIKKIVMSDKIIRTWYNSPYPAEYVNIGDTMYICMYCLKYTADPETYSRHKRNCKLTHPPGQEIYRDQDRISVFEIDGYKHKIYCQNLCLLAKLFLDHKILYYDVNSFLFYVLTEYDDELGGHRFIGYFSKERSPDVNNNVSCIVILPGSQNKGYGNFLIDFSYLLTRAEGKIGGPETPLSDLGFAAYSKYWFEVVVHEFQQINPYDTLSFNELAKKTGILVNHIITTLEWMECWVKTKDGQYVVNFEKISRIPDMLPTRRRPNSLLLRWNKTISSFKSNKD